MASSVSDLDDTQVSESRGKRYKEDSVAKDCAEDVAYKVTSEMMAITSQVLQDVAKRDQRLAERDAALIERDAVLAERLVGSGKVDAASVKGRISNLVSSLWTEKLTILNSGSKKWKIFQKNGRINSASRSKETVIIQAEHRKNNGDATWFR